MIGKYWMYLATTSSLNTLPYVLVPEIVCGVSQDTRLLWFTRLGMYEYWYEYLDW